MRRKSDRRSIVDDTVTGTVSQQLEKAIENPQKFLRCQPTLARRYKTLAKKVYDVWQTEASGENRRSASLPQLVVKGFHDEQIWQQIEMRNEEAWKRIVREGRQEEKEEEIEEEETEEEELEEQDDEGTEVDESENESEEEDMSEEEKELERVLNKAIGEDAEKKKKVEEREDQQEEEDDAEEERDEEEEQKGECRVPPKASIVDDQFFRLAEMEEFLKMEDAREEKQRRNTDSRQGDDEESSDEESIDYFEDVPSSENESDEEQTSENQSSRDAKYRDFFDPPSTATKSRQNLLDSDSEDEKDEAPKSSFEKRQEKLKQRIEELEKINMTEKPWQLMGESSASTRPENALLEEYLEFDHTTNPAPIITEETTFKLEDLIKKRIKDKSYDDVERKIKPVEDPYEYKKRLILDQEKSKLSLAEVYEKEYLNAQRKDKTQEELPEHREIRTMMAELFTKLDALSNFHFVPKPVAPDVRVVSNAPAITVEEVAPVAVSDANLLAPEEIKEKQKRDLKDSKERTKTDKKRERRQKKHRQQEKYRKLDTKTKLKAGIGNKRSKISNENNKNNKKSSALTSSKNFFAQLQAETTSQVKAKIAEKKRKQAENTVSSKRFKL